MSASNKPIISIDEVAKHRYVNDCWIVFYNKVYDLTPYLQHHPGGTISILKHAGTNATSIFESIHSETVLSTLSDSYCIGTIDNKESNKSISKQSILTQYHQNDKTHQSLTSHAIPSLNELLHLEMFKKYAMLIMKPRALNYCVPGADDEITLSQNKAIYSKILLRPKCILNHTVCTKNNIDTSCNMLGTTCSMPLFLCPTGLNKLFHPNGELAVIHACYNQHIIPIISTFCSYSLKQIFHFSDIISNGRQNIWYQLYVCQDHNVTKKMMLEALQYKCNTFVVTVDAPQVGRREKDIKYNLENSNVAQDFDGSAHIVKGLYDKTNKSKNSLRQGTAGRLSSFINPSLTWNDVVWIRSFLDRNNKNNKRVKLILKGIQCLEDVLKVLDEYNDIVDAVILSNHGGRQLDTARSSLEVLKEVMDNIDFTDLRKNNIKIYIDGGIRSGMDMFKALAMGANGVGIGRPYLHGMSCDGSNGIERVIEILRNEFVDVMKYMRVSKIKQLISNRLIVDMKRIPNHFTLCPRNWSKSLTYTPLHSKL